MRDDVLTMQCVVLSTAMTGDSYASYLAVIIFHNIDNIAYSVVAYDPSIPGPLDGRLFGL